MWSGSARWPLPGAQHLAAGRPAAASAALRQGLALWRGPPLSDVDGEPFAAPEVTRLTELRLTAIEDCVDADLAFGDEHAVIGGLEAHIARHPCGSACAAS